MWFSDSTASLKSPLRPRFSGTASGTASGLALLPNGQSSVMPSFRTNRMPNSLYKKHVISISEFNRSDLELVLNTAQKLKAEPRTNLLHNKVIASCFFEASTRTRLSFETAIQRLGGRVIGFSDASNTSMIKKGETFADSIRIITGYADALVMRHHMEGAARLASDISPVPVINAGDGSNQHPSQTLLDLFTIFETQKRIDNISIAFVGDLKYGRTVHSLSQALCHYHANIFLMSPESLAMPDYILDDYNRAGIHFEICRHFEEIVPNVDILYMTRVQKERFDETEYRHIRAKYVLTPDLLKGAKPNMKILHPLPRIDEIVPEVDSTPYACYFQQARNGVFAREALLSLVLNEEV